VLNIETEFVAHISPKHYYDFVLQLKPKTRRNYVPNASIFVAFEPIRSEKIDYGTLTTGAFRDCPTGKIFLCAMIIMSHVSIPYDWRTAQKFQLQRDEPHSENIS
jgi:hypothetical protein